MRRLWTIVRKEFIHIVRDTRTLALIVLLPAALLLLSGTAMGGETGNIPMAVADQSKTDASRRYIEKFWANGYFDVVQYADSEAELLELIDRDTAEVGMLIPADFGRSIATGKATAVQFYLNDADPSNSVATQLGVEMISQMALQEMFFSQISQALGPRQIEIPITTHVKGLYNPDALRTNHMVPSLIAMILQIQAMLLTSLAIVREREQGTMEQLIVTPIKAWELMLGKIIPYILVAFVNTAMIIAVGIFWFDIPLSGSLLQLLGLSFIFIIGSLGLGVMISNISASQMQAMYIAVGVVLLPSVIISGLIIPRLNMPAVAYYAGELLPVTHYLEIIRGVMLKGVGAGFLWSAIWPLIALSVAFFAASVAFFRKRLR
ncbi:MAG: ABC transporter permease [Anaerolineae bacterium]|nr:ABC transporter permease [Anaerolineae bacterium]